MAEATNNEDALLKRIQALEEELAVLKRDGPKRKRIDKMSGEVVDSNPYR